MSVTETKERLSAKKLLDLPPTLLGRLNKHAATKRHGSANEIARRGIESELDRLDAVTSVEAQRMEKLRALAAASGTEVDAIIDKMLRDVTEPALALGTVAAG